MECFLEISLGKDSNISCLPNTYMGKYYFSLTLSSQGASKEPRSWVSRLISPELATTVFSMHLLYLPS